MTGMDIREISVRIGPASIVRDISFAVGDACLIALIGPNGAGKSTLLKAIAGLIPATGAVEIEGRGMARSDIAYLPQAFAVRTELSVLEVILLGRHERLGIRVPQEDVEDAAALLRRLNMAELARRAMRTLSGGQQQLVLIAQRLFRRPALLLLDEPTSALDLRHQLEALRMVRQHADETGISAIVAIHDINLALRFADKAAVIARGELIAFGPPETVVTAPLIERVYDVPVEVLVDSLGRRVVVPMETSGSEDSSSLSKSASIQTTGQFEPKSI